MSWIRKLFTPPVFADDEEKTRAAGFLNIIVWAGGAIILLASPGLIYFNETVADMWLSAGLIVAFLALLALALGLLHNGFVRAGSFVMCITVWVSVTAMIFFFGGLRTTGSSGYLLVIFIAGLLLGGRWAAVFGGLSLLTSIGVFLVYYEETARLIPVAIQEAIRPRGYVDFDDLFILLAYAVLMVVLLGLVRRNIVNILGRARSHERALAEMNRELQVSRDKLRARTRKL